MKEQSLFKRFRAYYTGYQHLFWFDTICAITIAGIDIAFPSLLRYLTNNVYSQDSVYILHVLPLIVLFFVTFYAVRFGCRYFVAYWGHVMGARMESRMREDLFDAYQRMSFSFYDKNKSGDLMSRLIQDLFDISEAAHHGPEFVIIGIIEIIGSFIIMSSINTPLSLMMFCLLVVVIAWNYYVNKRMKAVFKENRVRISEVNTQLEDSLQGMRVVKSFNAESTESQKFRSSNTAYLFSKERMYKAMGNYQACIAVLMGALYTLLVCLGGYLIAIGQMNAVDLATFALYITLFTTPIENILNFTETFQRAIAGFSRFVEIIDMNPDIQNKPGAKDLVISDAHVKYNDVVFHYNEENKAALKGLTLDIQPGKTLALVGPSGGGKSTTCALLPRFYDIQSGSITIDGQSISDVTVESLRQAIGIVQQDVYLFDGTVAENIAYGNPEASFEDVQAAAKAAYIHEFIESLPNGYDSLVGQRGARLSGGQKQRISIARVFLKNPSILILDEATSALDNESERAVQNSLKALSKDRTTIVIAHRLSTIKDADVIATVNDGKVVEIGTHKELLAQNGTYASYYALQFGEGVLA